MKSFQFNWIVKDKDGTLAGFIMRYDAELFIEAYKAKSWSELTIEANES